MQCLCRPLDTRQFTYLFPPNSLPRSGREKKCGLSRGVPGTGLGNTALMYSRDEFLIFNQQCLAAPSCSLSLSLSCTHTHTHTYILHPLPSYPLLSLSACVCTAHHFLYLSHPHPDRRSLTAGSQSRSREVQGALGTVTHHPRKQAQSQHQGGE